MRRRLFVALLLASAVAGSCTQDFVLEDGERPAADVERAKFAFAEGETEIELGSAPASLVPPAATEAPSATPPEATSTPQPTATPTPQQPATTGPDTTAEATVTGAATAPTGGAPDFNAIAANALALSIAIPGNIIDPGLELLEATTDIREVFPPEFPAGASLMSFCLVASGRQPDSGALSELQRVVQVTQLIWAHDNVPAAEEFYTVISTDMIDAAMANRANAYGQTYPNLELSWGSLDDLPQIADAVDFVIMLMNPNVAPDEPVQGPPVPIIYFIAMREGRATALLEIWYQADQNAGDVLLIAEVLASRVPLELRSSLGP